ncbi:MAG TPA: hypothetical protein VM869_33675 [Enhygromyxa sp.]|nr:hypothetical protein [Enhygromyxa sp.]
MSMEIDLTPSPEDLELLLEKAKPELEAFDPKNVVRRSVVRRRAVDLTEVLLTSWASMIDMIDAVLTPALAEQRKLEIKRLDTRAWVFYQADLAAEELHADISRKARRLLAKAVRGHDRLLLAWAVPTFGEDPEHAETLRDISRGSGRRDDAEDVLRLVALFRANWAEAAAKQKRITKAYLNEAAADAAKQLHLLRNGASNPARILADAAYSLWAQDYNELMQLGRYLTWRDDDSALRFPGIHEPASRSASEEEDDELADELDEDEAEDEDEGDEQVGSNE